VIRSKRFRALVLVATLGLAACGGGAEEAVDADRDATETPDAPESDVGVVIRDRLVNAASASVDAGSARMSMTMSMSMPGDGDVEFTAEGVTDFGSGNAQITMDMGAMLDAFGGTPEDFAPLDDDMTMEMRMVDGVMYMRYPAALAMLMGGGAGWIRFDPEAFSGELGLEDQFGQYEQAGPSQYLEYLAGIAEEGIEELGRAAVRDVETTHYRASIDLGLLDAVDGLDELGLEAIPVEVWIDDGGLLRRLRMDMSTAIGGSVVVDMEMYDYGVEVDVIAPPAEDVTDFTDFLGETGDDVFGEVGAA
jgi:hypothetical protein